MSGTLWEIMLPAFAECLALTGLHAYLGLHVLRRRVIFVDLTLAQIAALGTTVGLLFGMSTDTAGAYLLSLLFTLLGAGLFTFTRTRSSRIPQEAIIGLIYAVAAALAILLVSEGPYGAKQVKSIMTGRLLWVDWGTVGVTVLVYGSLGIFHVVFRRRLIAISNDHEAAARAGISVRLWDFAFYVSFGVAISLSVRTAGVLLVFVFLMVPAIVATLASKKLSVQLAIGWSVGTVVTATGLALSYWLELPSGPTVVTFYGVALAPLAVGLWWVNDGRRAAALGKIGAGAALVIALVAGLWGLGEGLADTAWAHDEGNHHRHAADTTHLHGAAPPHGTPHPPGHPPAPPDPRPQGEKTTLLERLQAADPLAQEALLSTESSLEKLQAVFDQAEETSLAVQVAKRMGALSKREGARALIAVLASDAFPFEKDEAATALEQLAGRSFGFSPEGDEAKNRAALEAAQKWLESNE